MSEAGLQRFADFRDRHRGAAVVVCGCGRSLASLAAPERYVTVGVNDVGRQFTPDYIVVVNDRRQFTSERYRHIEGSTARAVFTQLPDLEVPGSVVVRFGLGRRAGVARPTDDRLDFTNNSPYVAVNLARHLGAGRIGLIGVDFTDDHFFARTGRHPLRGQLARIDAEFAALAAACRAEGVDLVNLSPSSLLRSLPRARLEPSGGWTMLPVALRPGSPAPEAAAAEPSQRPLARLTIAVESRPTTGPIGQLLDALAGSARALGHAVVRNVPRSTRLPGTLSVVWNGRGLAGPGRTLFCEHGWLPRSDYQISPRGINADSHAATFDWDRRALEAAESAALDAHFAKVKAAALAGQHHYSEAGASEPLPEEFLLVPLQMEGDTNLIRHAPANLRTMRALVDFVSRLDPPWPVVYKQHPADARGSHAQLKLVPGRLCDRIRPDASGNVHALLSSGACRGILAINSNVAHDGLLWDIPAIVLGRNVWPASGRIMPFLTAVPLDWSALAESATAAEAVACRRAYAYHLVRHQWTLDEARDPERVAWLLESVARDAGARAPPPPRLVPAPRRRPVAPVVNVVCENRGWLFENWKHALVAAGQPPFQVVASARPLPDAAAYIFVRAAEAARTPCPERTLVQIHDFAADGIYRKDGARAGVAACAAVSLTHPAQRAILEGDGIALALRRWLVQPVGWREGRSVDGAAETRARVAWVGRPARRDGLEVSGLSDFLLAARGWAGLAEVVLVGERLEAATYELCGAGVACRALPLSQCPIHRASEWLSYFDAVVVTSAADAGPWPIFDALKAGVPVIALSIGWAETLLADGGCGRLVRDAGELELAVRKVVATRERWRQQRAIIRERVAAQSFAAWARANLQLAAALAQPPLRQAI
jgi:hypothetical protein